RSDGVPPSGERGPDCGKADRMPVSGRVESGKRRSARRGITAVDGDYGIDGFQRGTNERWDEAYLNRIPGTNALRSKNRGGQCEATEVPGTSGTWSRWQA